MYITLRAPNLRAPQQGCGGYRRAKSLQFFFGVFVFVTFATVYCKCLRL